MKHQRSLIAVLALACSGVGVTETNAGALCDWLCHRKRAAPATTAYRPVVAPTTTAYAPQGSCGPGWCQQTVVKYMPQVAYRTVYQPVPVTTYKTSTSINPANGLPRTCTRPCTSYQYQARRVPYTTYRPVYTTVPVSDPLANQPTAPPPTVATPWQSQQSTSYAPASPSCNSCSTAPAATSWATPPASNGASSYNPAGATPWQPVPPTSSAASSPPPPGYGTPSYGAPADSPGATPWSNEPVGPPSGAPATGGAPADQRPSLKPEVSNSGSGLTPVPKPQAVLRQDLKREQEEDAQRSADDGVTDFNRVQRPAVASAESPSQVAGASSNEGLFQTGEPAAANASAKDPALQPPANQAPTDPRSARRYENAIRDVQRSYYPSNDQTAARPQRGTMPRVQQRQWQPAQPTTRYAAAPANRMPASRSHYAAPKKKHEWIPR